MLNKNYQFKDFKLKLNKRFVQVKIYKEKFKLKLSIFIDKIMIKNIYKSSYRILQLKVLNINFNMKLLKQI